MGLEENNVRCYLWSNMPPILEGHSQTFWNFGATSCFLSFATRMLTSRSIIAETKAWMPNRSATTKISTKRSSAFSGASCPGWTIWTPHEPCSWMAAAGQQEPVRIGRANEWRAEDLWEVMTSFCPFGIFWVICLMDFSEALDMSARMCLKLGGL